MYERQAAASLRQTPQVINGEGIMCEGWRIECRVNPQQAFKKMGPNVLGESFKKPEDRLQLS